MSEVIWKWIWISPISIKSLSLCFLMYSKVQGKGSDLSGQNCPLLLATTPRLKVWCMLRKFYCQTKIDPKEIFLQVVYKLKLKYQWEKVSQKFPITVKPLKYLRPMLINKCCVSLYQDLVCLSFFCAVAENRKYSLMEKLDVYE